MRKKYCLTVNLSLAEKLKNCKRKCRLCRRDDWRVIATAERSSVFRSPLQRAEKEYGHTFPPVKKRLPAASPEEPYMKCPHHPEHLQYATVTGERVRSKSEAYIFDALYQRGIPFRYDCALTLGGRTIYPDFIIMHPVTKEIYIWEHFGLLDDPEYFSGAKHFQFGRNS